MTDVKLLEKNLKIAVALYKIKITEIKPINKIPKDINKNFLKL